MDTDFDNEDENRITLLVHDTKPPFLDGRIVFTKQVCHLRPTRTAVSNVLLMRCTC